MFKWFAVIPAWLVVGVAFAQTPTPVPTSIQPAWRYVPSGLGQWTSATPIDATLLMLKNEPLNSCILVGINSVGDTGGGALTFEASLDGVRYVSVTPHNFVGGEPMIVPLPLPWGIDAYHILRFEAVGFRYVRVRLNPAITGPGTVSFGYMLEAADC